MSEPSIDPSLLPTFLAVVDAGRVSLAAKRLHLSQPAVTAQIRKLENAAGTILFDRSVHGVTPTADGVELARHAREVMRLLDRAKSALRGSVPALGPLVVAASTTVAAHVLPPLLATFRHAHPDVAIRVRIGNTEEVIAALSREHIALGLVEGHARAAGVRLEPFVDDELLPVSSHALRARIRTRADLAAETILWREPGSGTRAVVERALRQASIRRGPSTRDIELGSNAAIVSGAAAGLGVAFVSRWSVDAHVSAGRVAVLAGLDLAVRRTFRWALPAGALTGSAARFYELAVRHAPLAPL